MTKLEERYWEISTPIMKLFNSHTKEERKELALHCNDIKCLTLIQVLSKYNELLPKIAKDKIKVWLESSIEYLEELTKELGYYD